MGHQTANLRQWCHHLDVAQRKIKVVASTGDTITVSCHVVSERCAALHSILWSARAECGAMHYWKHSAQNINTFWLLHFIRFQGRGVYEYREVGLLTERTEKLFDALGWEIKENDMTELIFQKLCRRPLNYTTIKIYFYTSVLSAVRWDPGNTL